MEKIIHYVRKDGKKRTPVAVLMAIQKENRVGIGYALCNRKDPFIKVKGNEIAEKRAVSFLDKDPRVKQTPIPHTIKQALPKFIARAKKYFADKEFPAWAEDLVAQE